MTNHTNTIPKHIHSPKNSDLLDICGGLTEKCLEEGFQPQQLELNFQPFPQQQQQEQASQQQEQQQQSPQQQQQSRLHEIKQETVATPTIVENGVDIVIFKGYDHRAEVQA